MNYSEKPLDLR